MWVVFYVAMAGIVILGVMALILAGMWRRQKSNANMYIHMLLDRTNIVSWIQNQLRAMEEDQSFSFSWGDGSSKLYSLWDEGVLDTTAAKKYFDEHIRSWQREYPDLEVVFQPARIDNQLEFDRCLKVSRLGGWLWKLLDAQGVQIYEHYGLAHEEAFKLPQTLSDLNKSFQTERGRTLVVLSPSGRIHRNIVFEDDVIGSTESPSDAA